MNCYKDKYFSFMGDSITTFEGCIPDGYSNFYTPPGAIITGINSYADTWWGQVLKHFGAELLVNNSWSGSFLTKQDGTEIESYAASDARCSSLAKDGVMPDHIIVYIGTNDRGFGAALTGNDKDDISVIENAYEVMLGKMKENCKNAVIWCCTLPRVTCKRDPYMPLPKTWNRLPLEEYNKIISDTAQRCDCKVIDLAASGLSVDTIDGLHPNKEGMTVIANAVISVMSENA